EQLEREGRSERLSPPGLPGETETGEEDGDSESLAEARPGAIARAWHQLTPQQQDELFDALCEEVNKYQRLRGEPELKFGQPLLAHPSMDLYVAADSPHPVSRMGCTVCHEGNGEETDFVLAAHTPKTKQERHEWEE